MLPRWAYLDREYDIIRNSKEFFCWSDGGYQKKEYYYCIEDIPVEIMAEYEDEEKWDDRDSNSCDEFTTEYNEIVQ